MAYKHYIAEQLVQDSPNLAKFPFLYNVDLPVGVGCPNLKLDVMMVQMLLRVCISDRTVKDVIGDKPNTIGGDLNPIQNPITGRKYVVTNEFDPLNSGRFVGPVQSIEVSKMAMNGIFDETVSYWIDYYWTRYQLAVNVGRKIGKIMPFTDEQSELSDGTFFITHICASIISMWGTLSYESLAVSAKVPLELRTALK